jgi:glycosyltransferase involved in cell wall biosynthesis
MNINTIFPINGLGYGVAGTNIAKELYKAGHNVSLFPIGNIQLEDELNIPIFNQMIANQATYDSQAPSIRLWHQFALAETVGQGRHIGFPIFELDTFTEREKHHLSNQDELFVCSKWAKQIVLDSGINIEVNVVPLGVDQKIFYPNGKHGLAEQGNRPYTFFNSGKWEIRKGHDILVEMFNRAFTKDDDVQLNLLTGNPFLNEDETAKWVKLYKNSPLGDKILLIDRCPTQYHVAGLMRQADCGIFPSRAEGWNLELLEMMACGKPVIATNHSSHTEFCTPANAELIHIIDTEKAYDNKWFFGQGSWAKIDEDQIEQGVVLMRNMYKNRIHDNPQGVETAKQFSWNNTAKTITQLLDY